MWDGEMMTRRFAAALMIGLLVGGTSRVALAQATEKGAGVDQDKVVVDEKTEQIIRGALKWLAAKQNGSGSWSADGNRYEVAMTGYTLMAFLAAGQLPDEGEYGKTVAKAVSYLLNTCKSDGLIQASNSYGNEVMYSHGIATIALAEVYGQTRDPRIKNKLESAIKLIIKCQNHEGGWRYQPRAADADMSVTVLQVVAVRAAKNAGLDVPQETIDRAVAYVLSCYDERSHGFTYQPRNNTPGFARTAAAIYSLQVCGKYDDPHVKLGADYLSNRSGRGVGRGEWFTYGHFYAAPAMYMIGGTRWEKWYREVGDLLVKNVKKQGEGCYWTPEWDQRQEGGALYCTAVYTTILAMPYHYVPLYQR